MMSGNETVREATFGSRTVKLLRRREALCETLAYSVTYCGTTQVEHVSKRTALKQFYVMVSRADYVNFMESEED
jgi:hypothetical protein